MLKICDSKPYFFKGMLELDVNSAGKLPAAVCEVDLATKTIHFGCEDYAAQRDAAAKRIAQLTKLLNARSGWTNRGRRALNRERRFLLRWMDECKRNAVATHDEREGARELERTLKGWRRMIAREKKGVWLIRKALQQIDKDFEETLSSLGSTPDNTLQWSSQ
jgi:hypothetical protein